MAIPLEDQFNDVLAKASRGLGKSPSQLAEESGLSLDQVRSLLEGTFDAKAAGMVAGCLGLDGERVIALGSGAYRAEPVGMEGLRQFNTPFDDMTVNAYLVWDPNSDAAAVFDTGSDAQGAIDAAAGLGKRIEQVFLTHSHGDHIYDLDRLVSRTGARAWIPIGEAIDGAKAFEPGREFAIGGLRVQTRLTWGHARGGVTYVILGLERPLAVCGDALFAGSMGGGTISYADALRTNRTEIFSLGDDTLLAPGHGPLTTVGEQRRANPFFPEV